MSSTEDVQQWLAVARDPRVDSLLTQVFEEADELARRKRPLCIASGRCCRFEEHGHRLYVTGLEVAWFLHLLETREGRTVDQGQVDSAQASGTCPFLADGMCTVHAIRPFGCRSYFCDPRATWQAEAYEGWHARIRDFHEEHAIAYDYGEWRSMLHTVLDGMP